MKKLLLLFVLFSICAIQDTQAQDCIPDRSLYDTHVPPNYLFPAPYDSMTMMGGFEDTTCIGSYFETSLNFVIPKEVDYNGVILPVTNIEVTAVTGLPDGINYACTPSSCDFRPIDTVACVSLYGTASVANAVGDYKLGIEGTANVGFVLPLNTLIAAGGGGAYYLYVRDGTSPVCTGVATENPVAQAVSIRNAPNPFSDITTVEIQSEISGQFNFNVINMLGATVHSEKVNIDRGNSQIIFDGSQLSEGIYFYTFSNEHGRLGGKLMINR